MTLIENYEAALKHPQISETQRRLIDQFMAIGEALITKSSDSQFYVVSKGKESWWYTEEQMSFLREVGEKGFVPKT